MLKIFKTDFHFEDERGTINQLIHDGYKQINVITSKKGVIRGNHFHKLNNEAFYVVSGALEVTVNGETHTFSSGDFFGIEPNDMHSFFYLEDTILVSMYSSGVELSDGSKDIYTE
jgi:quercetin dioxygenase-like cupin family protein